MVGEQIKLMANASEVFAMRLVSGVEANRDLISRVLDSSAASATALAPHIGYEKTAGIVKRAKAEGRSVREIAVEEQVLPDEELDRILDPRRQTEPG